MSYAKNKREFDLTIRKIFYCVNHANSVYFAGCVKNGKHYYWGLFVFSSKFVGSIIIVNLIEK